MTKKSYSRMKRDEADEQLKNNKCYDDLAQVYDATKQLFIPIATMREVLGTTGLYPYLPNPELVKANAESITKDLKVMNERLTGIRKAHETDEGELKKGGGETIEEVLSTFQISEEYAKFTYEFQEGITPMVATLLDQFTEAANRKINDAKQSVVIDVVPTESPAAEAAPINPEADNV